MHELATAAIFVASGIAFVVTGHRPTAYGRYDDGRPGPPERIGWCLIFAPLPISFVTVYVGGRHATELVPLVLAAAFCGHALYRGFIDPWRRRPPPGRTIAWRLVVAGALASALLGGLNGQLVGDLAPPRTWRWLISFRFLYGAMLFITGLGVSRWADGVLRKLRRRGEGGHQIPRGALFDDVSCPNYLGEILMWIGWAIATWSAIGLATAAWTAARLLPRAFSHHLWYRRRFVDYPRRRTALIPYIL